ncbi:MFS transporter [Pyrobaculum calidifontis]|uniref:MFS transporter n=1 Tax=Pyrobaculum calidifontis TaxID=181486 RepID=UPI000326B239|nr:MFS transporter [Pyrobaculum calidifontis]
MGYTSSATNTSKPRLSAYVLYSSPYSFVAFLLPFYIFELGHGEVEVGIAYASYAAAVVVIRPAAGHLADKAGRRLSMGIGGVLLSASMTLLSLSTSISHVYAAMFLSGVASSLINVAAVAYVSDVGGLEDPALYSKLKIAAAAGAVAGGVSIPAVYILSKLMGYAAAFRLTALAFAALSAAALFHLPEETRHLAVRHHRTDVRVLSCIIVASLLAGLSTGLYGPQVLPFLHDRFSLSPFAAVLAYLPAAISWFVGPRLARPARSSVALGSLVVAVALIGMAYSPSPYIFSAIWVLESLGVAVLSTSLEQMVSRNVAGVYWARGYGVYQGVNNLGYAVGAAVSGYMYPPFLYAVIPAVALSALSLKCLKPQ